MGSASIERHGYAQSTACAWCDGLMRTNGVEQRLFLPSALKDIYLYSANSVAVSLSEGRCDYRVAAEMHRTPLRQADALILPTLAPARAAEQTKPLTCITAAVKVAVLNKGSVLIPGDYPRVLDECKLRAMFSEKRHIITPMHAVICVVEG